MVEQSSFRDPLEDIDPVMKDAFTGGNPMKRDRNQNHNDDEDSFDDSPFQKPIKQVAPKKEVSFDYGDDDDDNEFDVFDDREEILGDHFESKQSPERAYSRGAQQEQPRFEDRRQSHHISDIQFPSLARLDNGSKLETDIFSSIPVNVSVELGRSKISLKEIFELTEGSIIELDRLVGEPLDLVVNGQVVAQGEVVAIDNNYGLRVTRVTATPQP
jgi:flagellar motor switch protein FliN